MGRGGFAARDGAAGAVQERTRQGGMKLTAPPEDEIPPWTLTGLGEGGAFTQPKSPVQEEGVDGGTWFPRQIARGPRCGAALRFRRSAAILVGPTVPRPVAASFVPARGGNPHVVRGTLVWPAAELSPGSKKKSAPRGAFSLLFSFFTRRGRTSPGRSPKGHRSKPRPLSPCRCTA